MLPDAIFIPMNALSKPTALDRPPIPGVILDAASPDKSTARGAGLTLVAGVANSPFGHCLIAECERGICHLAFFDTEERTHSVSLLESAWHLAQIRWNHNHASHLVSRIFATPPQTSPPPPWQLFVRGTQFQLDIWRALLRIPAGAVVSYGKLAAAAGHPSASRATGAALGANPIAFLIPCHRVIRQSGDSGHYRWGAVRKRAMLAWEAARKC